MKHVEQEVILYQNYEEPRRICSYMNNRIANGWRVHTCLERQCYVLVVYERDLADSELRG